MGRRLGTETEPFLFLTNSSGQTNNTQKLGGLCRLLEKCDALGLNGGGMMRLRRDRRGAEAQAGLPAGAHAGMRPSASSLYLLLPLVFHSAGCSCHGPPWVQPPLPASITPEAIQARVVGEAAQTRNSELGIRSEEQSSSALPVPSSEFVRFTLPEAVDFALQNSPRLWAAVAAIERRGAGRSRVFSLPAADRLSVPLRGHVREPGTGGSRSHRHHPGYPGLDPHPRPGRIATPVDGV